MNFKNISKRNFLVMLLGLFFIAPGIAFFKLSLLGNDPGSAFVMAWADVAGVDFTITNFVFCSGCFLLQFLFGRRYIGIGTFATWFLITPVASLEYRLLINTLGGDFSLPARLLLALLGVLTISLGASLYQTADLGISPYDCLAIMLDDRLPLPYFWCRIFTDSVCTVMAFMLGGIVGLGTLMSALGLGPFIAFFTKHIAIRLCPSKSTSVKTEISEASKLNYPCPNR